MSADGQLVNCKITKYMESLGCLTHWDGGSTDYNLDSRYGKHGTLDILREPLKGEPCQDEAEEVLEDDHQSESLNSRVPLIPVSV